MNLINDDAVIKMMNEVIENKVEERLQQMKMTFATIDIKTLSELTSLSESTLNKKFVNHPEFVKVKRRVGTRVLYKHPECLKAYEKILEEMQ